MISFIKTEKALEWMRNKLPNDSEVNRFKSNLLSISNNYGLNGVNPATIMTACYQGTLLQLPMEPNFGFAYVVPYNVKQGSGWIKQAQFQMGYKGYIQLALRSGQYKQIEVSDVREGELKKYDRLKGVELDWVQDEVAREKLPIIGYVAYIELTSTFNKMLYMTKSQMEAHFNKYSKIYAKEQKFAISSFDDMAKKTVIKLLISKWGPLSVDMQQAVKTDQSIISPNGEIRYVDNEPDTSEVPNAPVFDYNSNDHIVEVNEPVGEEFIGGTDDVQGEW